MDKETGERRGDVEAADVGARGGDQRAPAGFVHIFSGGESLCGVKAEGVLVGFMRGSSTKTQPAFAATAAATTTCEGGCAATSSGAGS